MLAAQPCTVGKGSECLEAEYALEFATVINAPCGLTQAAYILRYPAAGSLMTFELGTCG